MSSLDAAIYNEARLARKFSEVVGSRRQLILRRVVTSSEVLTLPAGHYDIIAVGAGGSGGAGYGSLRTTGGGGPAWARDWGFLAAPTPITITVGARAMGVTGSTAGVNGAAGGTTTVTGNLAPITLTGGGGGRATNAGTGLDGGAGGVATGGLIRANGGRGGNIRGSGPRQATGGGAVDIFCLGADKTRGGDSLGAGTALGTGGGGVGGRGGDATGVIQSTGGGGAGGDALDLAAAAGTCGPSINGSVGDGATPTDLEIADILLAYPGIAPVGGGYIVNPSFGGGSSQASSDTPVPFGGSAGRSASSGPTLGHTVSRGGGSGGASGSSTSGVSGAGGEAFVIVSVYAEAA